MSNEQPDWEINIRPTNDGEIDVSIRTLAEAVDRAAACGRMLNILLDRIIAPLMEPKEPQTAHCAGNKEGK
jgi:hypothetical protein